jgi:hypothetical protein
MGDALTSAIQTRLNYNVISTFILIGAAVSSALAALNLFLVTYHSDKHWVSRIR